MGKGNRNRKASAAEHPAWEQPLAHADRLDKTARTNALFAFIASLVFALAPAFCNFVISYNLSDGKYEKSPVEDVMQLTRMLPVGNLALVLIPVAALLFYILIRLRKPALSLIGIGIGLAGDIMLVFFAITMNELFAYDPLARNGYGSGLQFWELFFRYYILLLPTLMQIASVCVGFVAHKKREIAEVMQHASDDSSTLTLDEEETIQTAP